MEPNDNWGRQTGWWILRHLLPILILVSVSFSPLIGENQQASIWPVYPDSSRHSLSAVYGDYLEHAGLQPMHSGVDIAVPAGTPVYAVESGWVKTVTTVSDNRSNWRIVIANASGTGECEGWMYAHVDANTMPSLAFDQWVEAETYLGDIVDWDEPGTIEHLHLSWVKYNGDWDHWANNFFDWMYIANPLNLLPADNDTVVPVLENAYGSQLLAFCNNDEVQYIGEGEAVLGDVDIIARVYDYYNWFIWKAVPYSMDYKIEGDSSIPWTTSACFTDPLGSYGQMHAYEPVVYQYDWVCNSNRDADDQKYYFNLTNTDGDSIVEESDGLLCWQTGYFPNGEYKVFVRARDKSGNEALDSMTVTVGNFSTLSGNLTYNDGIPDLTGTVIISQTTGTADTTDENGDFSLADIPGAMQTFTVSRLGCQSIDTGLIMYGDRELIMNMIPVEFVAGDANYDGKVNIGDAVYLTNLVFHEGPAPRPYYAGDTNSDGSVNIGDVVYLVNFIFHDGPPPTKA